MYPLKCFENFEEYLITWGIVYDIIKWKKGYLQNIPILFKNKLCNSLLHTHHACLQKEKWEKPDVSQNANWSFLWMVKL